MRKRLQWYGHIKRMQEERLPKLIMEWIPWGKKKKRTSKKNVDGRCMSSHENKTFRTRSVVKQKGKVVWVPEDGDSCHKTGKIGYYYYY